MPEAPPPPKIVVKKKYKSTEERFWEKVDKNGPVIREELGQCWVWTAATDTTGYGVIAINRILVGAHRYRWAQENGPIPDGMKVMHKCDNPPCVRPSHLGIGTNADNLRDMAEKGRARGGRRTKDGQEPKNRRVDNALEVEEGQGRMGGRDD